MLNVQILALVGPSLRYFEIQIGCSPTTALGLGMILQSVLDFTLNEERSRKLGIIVRVKTVDFDSGLNGASDLCHQQMYSVERHPGCTYNAGSGCDCWTLHSASLVYASPTWCILVPTVS